MKGNVSKSELAKFLGRKDVEDIDYIKRKTEQGYKASKELTKKFK